MKPDSEKKKLVIFGALATVLVAVGAWQFLPLGGGPQGRPQTAAEGSAPAAAKVGDQAPRGSVRPEDGTSVADGSGRAQARVHGEPAQPHTAPEGAPIGPAPGPPVGGAPVAGRRPQRDPFEQTGARPPAPDAEAQRPPGPGEGPRPGGIARPAAPPPSALNQPVPPLNPMPGPMPGELPAALPTPSTAPTEGAGAPRLTPGRPLRQPGELPMRLVGVVVGPDPVAVLQNDDGEQRTFRVGSEVVPGSRILSIERRKVVVRHLGRQVTLTLGGIP